MFLTSIILFLKRDPPLFLYSFFIPAYILRLPKRYLFSKLVTILKRNIVRMQKLSEYIPVLYEEGKPGCTEHCTESQFKISAIKWKNIDIITKRLRTNFPRFLITSLLNTLFVGLFFCLFEQNLT